MSQMKFDSTRERQAFHYTGLALLLLAIGDLCRLIPSIINGEFSLSTYAFLPNSDFIRIALVVVIILNVIPILMQVFLGTKAIAEASNPTTARYHLVVARVALVFNILTAISTAVSIFGTAISVGYVSTLILSLIDVAIIIIYIREGKKVRIH